MAIFPLISELRIHAAWFAIALLSCISTFAAEPTPTLMLISIDGLELEAVLEAQQHGLKLPKLQQLPEADLPTVRVRTRKK